MTQYIEINIKFTHYKQLLGIYFKKNIENNKMSESKFQKNNNEIIIRKNEKLNLNILTTPLKQCRIIQKIQYT